MRLAFIKRRMLLTKHLHLGHRSLPTSLASLKALRVLRLYSQFSTQRLTGTLPDAYDAGDAFPALELLDVENNRLSGSLPSLPGADIHAQKQVEHCTMVMTTAFDAYSCLRRCEIGPEKQRDRAEQALSSNTPLLRRACIRSDSLESLGPAAVGSGCATGRHHPELHQLTTWRAHRCSLQRSKGSPLPCRRGGPAPPEHV